MRLGTFLLAVAALSLVQAQETAVPLKPGSPHGSTYHPHQALDPETQIQIALQHQAAGRAQEALYALSQAGDLYPNYARIFAVRGSLRLEQGHIAQALADLERALQLDPEDVEALTNRAQAYRRFGRTDQALKDLDRAIALNPDLLAARFNRGVLRYEAQDYAGALEEFDACIVLDPHLPAPYFNRAVVQDALGHREAAIQDLERFLRISKEKTWNQQAEALLKAWKNPDAKPEPLPPSPH